MLVAPFFGDQIEFPTHAMTCPDSCLDERWLCNDESWAQNLKIVCFLGVTPPSILRMIQPPNFTNQSRTEACRLPSPSSSWTRISWASPSESRKNLPSDGGPAWPMTINTWTWLGGAAFFYWVVRGVKKLGEVWPKGLFLWLVLGLVGLRPVPAGCHFWKNVRSNFKWCDVSMGIDQTLLSQMIKWEEEHP